MRLIKKANKTILVINKKDWKKIGDETGWYKEATTFESVCAWCKGVIRPPICIDDGITETKISHGYCTRCYVVKALLDLVKQKSLTKVEATEEAVDSLREAMQNEFIDQSKYQSILSEFNQNLAQISS